VARGKIFFRRLLRGVFVFLASRCREDSDPSESFQPLLGPRHGRIVLPLFVVCISCRSPRSASLVTPNRKETPLPFNERAVPLATPPTLSPCSPLYARALARLLVGQRDLHILDSFAASREL